MNNREIVDYILSNKLKEEQVIKEFYYYKGNLEYVRYIYNDGFDLYDDNGKVSVMHFCDQIPNLNGDITSKYKYVIISSEECEKEQKEKFRKEKIEELERELQRLKGLEYE